MKIGLVAALVGLAISFALPTFAQQTKSPDPQLREKLVAAIKKHTDALDQNDAAAVAANFTEDGILVTPGGPISGREAIEKHYVDDCVPRAQRIERTRQCATAQPMRGGPSEPAYRSRFQTAFGGYEQKSWS